MYVLMLTTCPNEKVGRRIALALVSQHAAACVNVVTAVTSFYRWQGQMNEDQEVILVAKTRTEQESKARKIILENHPYELPELIVLPVAGGSDRYLRWLADETKTP